MSTTDPGDAERRQLVLMRHAKSDWGNQSLSDHDRPLNQRGTQAAPLMADWLAQIGVIPDLILSSTSTRTRETVALMTAQWDQTQPTQTADVSFSGSLYLATPEAILKAVASDGCDAAVLMVVAHNPGMTHLASHFATQTVDMPTAAIAIFDVAISHWSQLRPSSHAEMIQFMKPKSL